MSGATMDAPREAAHHATTAQEDPITPLPADILSSSLSPDGRWALLETLAPDHVTRAQVWAVNTVTGEQHRTPFRTHFWPQPVVWRPDRMVIPTGARVQTWHLAEARGEVQIYPALVWQAPSPDGRWLPGFGYVHGRNPRAQLVAIVYDLVAGAARIYPNVAGRFVWGSGRPPDPPFRWTENGRLLVEDQTEWDDAARRPVVRWLELDPGTGAVTPHSGPVPDAPAPREWLPGPAGWHVHRGETWGPVRVRAPDGSAVAHGEGHVLGWAADGRLLLVRWENAVHRRTRASGE